MYVQSPQLDNPAKVSQILRRRFCMPYDSFLSLLSMAEASPLFDRWKIGRADVTGQQAAPLSLLILCALHYIGRGWTVDDLSENTGISEEVPGPKTNRTGCQGVGRIGF